MAQGGSESAGLAEQHALVVSLTAAGVVDFVGPRPSIPGLWAVDDPVGRPFVDAILPVFRSLAEQIALGTIESAVLSLQEPLRFLAISVTSAGESRRLLGDFRVLQEPLRMPVGEGDVRTLRSILLHSRHGVLLYGAKAEVLMSNQAALELLGLDGAQLLGERPCDPDWRVVDRHGCDFPVEQRPVHVALATGQPVREVVMGVYRPSTSDWRWLEADALPEVDAAGEVLHVVCTLTDVTARLHAEAELRREHQLSTQVMETSIAGFCVLDPGGRMTFVNRAAEEILGLSRSELLGRRYDEPDWCVTDVDGGPWSEDHHPFSKVMSTGRPVMNLRHAIRWPDGRRKVLSLNGAPIKDERGSIVSCVFALADITDELRTIHERERLQEEMMSLSRLESMSVLASGVAHDLNNILVGVGAATESLAQRHAHEPDAEEEVSLLVDSVERIKELTNQLLAYSGKGQFVVGPADLSEEVRQTAQLLDSLCHENTKLTFDLDSGLPRVEIDRTQVRQILMNLVLNASEAFAGEPGNIRIVTGIVERTADEGQAPRTRFVTLEVRDDGPGMSSSVLRRIFDPFFTTKEGGSGLGLAAVQGIMRGHGGFVDAEAPTGQGACFRLGFPVTESSARRTTTLPPPSDGIRNPLTGTVLVIDDELVVQRSLKRMLTSDRCNVLLAGDGVTGLEILDAHPEVTLVLLDLTMPKMRGEAVLEQVRRTRPELPVVIMSGYSEVTLPIDSVGSSFIQKPFSRAALLACVAALLDSPL